MNGIMMMVMVISFVYGVHVTFTLTNCSDSEELRRKSFSINAKLIPETLRTTKQIPMKILCILMHLCLPEIGLRTHKLSSLMFILFSMLYIFQIAPTSQKIFRFSRRQPFPCNNKNKERHKLCGQNLQQFHFLFKDQLKTSSRMIFFHPFLSAL